LQMSTALDINSEPEPAIAQFSIFWSKTAKCRHYIGPPHMQNFPIHKAYSATILSSKATKIGMSLICYLTACRTCLTKPIACELVKTSCKTLCIE
jgi:hypothetical protein